VTLLLWLGLGDAGLLCHTGGELSLSSDGTLLAIGGEIWDAQTFQRISQRLPAPQVASLSPDGFWMAGAAIGETTIQVWEPSGLVSATLTGHTGAITDLDFSPDGTLLASVSQDGSLRLWNTAPFGPQAILGSNLGWLHCVAFSSDGQWLAAGSWGQPGLVTLWDVQTGELVYTLTGHAVYVNALSFAPDNLTLASASLDGSIRLWDVNSGRGIGLLQAHTGSVTSLDFSPDGVLLVSGSADQTVILWNVAQGQPIYTWYGFPGEVTSVVFSIDGKDLLASAANFTRRVSLATLSRQ